MHAWTQIIIGLCNTAMKSLAFKIREGCTYEELNMTDDTVIFKLENEDYNKDMRVMIINDLNIVLHTSMLATKLTKSTN